MKVYGLLAFRFNVLESERMESWPNVLFERRGLRRRGMGRAIGVGVWEGILVVICVSIRGEKWQLVAS